MRPTRRDAVLGGLTLAAPALRTRAGDGVVAVIGAGAAGLSAAAALRRAGHAVTVVEARSRIGGRAFTDRSLGPDLGFDAGAQYIHWAERNPWAAIARSAGARIADEDGWARALIVDGRPATDAERTRRRKGFGDLAGLARAAGDVSMVAAAEPGGPDAVLAAGALARMSLGEEPEHVSARDEDRLWNGTDLWVDGYGDLVARHFADIPVRLGTIVEAVDWSGNPVRVASDRGTLAADAVIVTVPVGVLPGLRFTPHLPEPVQAALHGLGMGAYTKVALALDPARIDPRAAGDAVSVARTGTSDLTMYFEAAPFGRPMLVANLGGDGARDLCRAGEAAAVAAARERLAAFLGSAAPAAVTGGRLADWWTDPFARGSYSIARPGHADARTALRAPIGDRVFLAGEALQEGGAMTVGGATLDGERAAQAVLRALSG